MSSFNDRENAYESKFVHDANLQFKAESRRNKLLGLWAAELLGKSSDDAQAYVSELIKADFKEAGDEDVYRKLAEDLGDKSDEATIRSKMNALMAQAHAEMKEEQE